MESVIRFRYMKKIFFIVFVCAFSKIGFSQISPFIPYYYTQVFKNDIQLKFPWLGGLNSPQFEPVDLNNDGIEDLVIFEKEGERLLTFENSGSGIGYSYAPKYEKNIPKINGWFLFKKITCDAISDFITDNKVGSSIVYKGFYNANNELSFTIFQDGLYYQGSGGTSINVYTSVIDRPAIIDMNGDGDIDLLAFSTTATRILYYENQKVELGISCDTIVFKLVDRCWGNVSESGLEVPLTLRDSCTDKPPQRDLFRHSGSCMEAYDIDGNGRKDLLMGDVVLQNVNFLKNEGTLSYASILEQDIAFPSYDVPVSINSFACPVIMDIDNDSKKDMIVTPFERNGGENYQNVFFYKNISNTSALNLRLQQKDFLVGDMIEVGSGAVPRFFDYNGDGLLDILISNENRKIGNNDGEFFISLFENIGKIDYPYFKLVNEDYLGLVANNLNGPSSIPYFGDLDGDGDLDCIVGREDGRLLFFRNKTNGLLADFEFINILKNNLNTEIDIGQNAFPNLVDIDRNGTLDLIIGERNGNLNYYKNIGTQNAPNFEFVTDSLGKIKVGFSSFSPGFTAPEIRDFNNDNKWDLMLGNINGDVLFYNNIEDSLTAKWTAQRDTLLVTKKTSRSTYTAADITGDGKLEIIKGNFSGGLELFSQNPPPFQPVGIKQNTLDLLAFNIFPNPSKQEIYITLNNTRNTMPYNVNVFDVNGRSVKTMLWTIGETINIADLESGIYFIQVSNTNESGIRKLVKIGD